MPRCVAALAFCLALPFAAPAAASTELAQASPPAAAGQSQSGCAVVAQGPARTRLAARDTRLALAAGEVKISFIGHSTFEIESPAGVRAATDYNDVVRPARTPDIATMNKAHSTHNSRSPDPGIKHLLPGWNPAGGPARHDVTERDMRVRNVSTNIRDWGSSTDYSGNSIFIFETSGLCVAHLGHLHHTLDADKLADLGRVDVLLVPVDGSWTMDQQGMIEVIEQIKAPLMIPMHYFSGAALERFIGRLGDRVAVRRAETGTLTVSRDSLPDKPTLMVLPGRLF
ncbi:MAG: MBL fold metallo-hydrolase [Methylobacteriaceae bacterium]|nr:MBL fold metallo-hydrolase [Methylobacteriaceae bacterium]